MPSYCGTGGAGISDSLHMFGMSGSQLSAVACRPTGGDPGVPISLSTHGPASVMLGVYIVGWMCGVICVGAKVCCMVMVDGNDEWLSAYGTDGADTCTHDDVACDDCVGSGLIAISICGGAT